MALRGAGARHPVGDGSCLGFRLCAIMLYRAGARANGADDLALATLATLAQRPPSRKAHQPSDARSCLPRVAPVHPACQPAWLDLYAYVGMYATVPCVAGRGVCKCARPAYLSGGETLN